MSADHPQVMECFEVGASKMWHDDEFAGGAFALFDPGQQTLLHDHIVAPEGRIHRTVRTQVRLDTVGAPAVA
jgi:monoamine oxidase